MQNNESRKSIARIWRGRTTPQNAAEYTEYLYQHGVKKLEALGARGVQMFREDRDSDSYFMVISFWDTRDAMTRWAGSDPTKIRHLERDAELLVELPSSVQILEVVSNNWMLADAMRA
ncbi:antibiotic biosynthesis monooxygenase [Ensifer sp. ENS04]|uniref:antibiotic biosynthesis monooxygenase family protein n=1 Tax=Ensifer sp. ENS04 TaxID=2769281 RepID=UPI001AED850D|nr:antibiotic biosynthesis monooxygenase [Ensifer sp. ENS04]